MTQVFKLLRAAEWASFKAEGVFAGSLDDLRDGFIHLSDAAQVTDTRTKYFANDAGVVLLTLDAEALGEALRWEASRAGALFPHLYRALRLDEVRLVPPSPA